MFTPKSDFLRVVKERGFFHQATDFHALDELAEKDGLAGYIGFDATATSLHAESVAALHAGSPDIALSLIDAALADGAIDPLFRCHREAALRLRRRMQRI